MGLLLTTAEKPIANLSMLYVCPYNIIILILLLLSVRSPTRTFKRSRRERQIIQPFRWFQIPISLQTMSQVVLVMVPCCPIKLVPSKPFTQSPLSHWKAYNSNNNKPPIWFVNTFNHTLFWTIRVRIDTKQLHGRALNNILFTNRNTISMIDIEK